MSHIKWDTRPLDGLASPFQLVSHDCGLQKLSIQDGPGMAKGAGYRRFDSIGSCRYVALTCALLTHLYEAWPLMAASFTGPMLVFIGKPILIGLGYPYAAPLPTEYPRKIRPIASQSARGV